MKRILFIIPLLGVSAFAGYYHYWNATQNVIECSRRADADPYDEYRYRNGKQDAENDIARGELQILTYGLPAPWAGEYREILRRDYGVELRSVAGCMVSTPLVDYVAAYNAVAESRLVSIHGPDLFNKLHLQAQALFTERHAHR